MPPLRLEVFESDAARRAGRAAAAGRAARERERAAAYEQGFRAGREEEEAARDDEESRIRARVAASLEALSFTWEEARNQLLISLEPLMTAIVGQLLPEMARRTVAPIALEHLMPLAGERMDKPLALMVHPAAREPVERLLGDMTRLPLRIGAEPALGEGQVAVHSGGAETVIDLSRVVAEIDAALGAFFATTREDAGDE